MDDRKRRIMMAIVSLYSSDGEPVGSSLLSRYLDMAVSSATLRNEMAALTRLGLLEQPHTSAGRVPTAKGYRYYVDSLLDASLRLLPAEKHRLNTAFRRLDYDPEKMVQGAARALADTLGQAVIATTPRADDVVIAHYEVIQVGRYRAAVLAVTGAGGVRTRVAKVEYELSAANIRRIAEALNRYLCFVAEADTSPALLRAMVANLGEDGPRAWPVMSAALTLLAETGRPRLYLEGYRYLPGRHAGDGGMRVLMEMADEPERVDALLRSREGHTTVIFGDELPERPMVGLCLLSRRYLAGGGQSGTLAVAGSMRMDYREVIPKLEYFSDLLGKGMSGSLAG